MIALVDCNNFFVSCERLARPDLGRRAVVVLSSNDGCVISRSQEAKDLGIGMGQPAFELRDLRRRGAVVACSANFALYADLSRRVMAVLAAAAPAMEVHSIDEAFLDLGGLPDAADWAAEMRRRIGRWVGIPVSAGLGPTRTLAKLAGDRAKRAPDGVGAIAPGDPELARIPVEDVWGIGRRLGQRLRAAGIASARQVQMAGDGDLRRIGGIGLARTAAELRGEPCAAPTPPEQRSLMVSRSFGRTLGELADLRAAVAAFAERAGERLRAAGLLAHRLSLHVEHGERSDARSGEAAETAFPAPTDITPDLIAAALALLDRLYRPDRRYRKAGIALATAAAGARQTTLFDDPAERSRARAAMAAIDGINRRHGGGTIGFAAAGLGPAAWRPRHEARSPAWTTDWEDLLAIPARL